MPWQCFMVTHLDLDEPRQVYPTNKDVTTRVAYRLQDGTELLFRELPIGAMWQHPRRGLCVKLPGDVMWAMEEVSTDGKKTKWCILGTPPLISVTPSIDKGIYHGFITNGIISDDLNTRK